MRAEGIILQRVIPHYRKAFFEEVYKRYGWRVVAAETPPNGTYLNLCRPEEVLGAIPFPMKFYPKRNICHVDVGRLIRETGAKMVIAEFSLHHVATYTLPVYRALQKISWLCYWTHGWSMHRSFNGFTDNLSHYGRLPLFGAADHILTYSREGAEWVARFIESDKITAMGNTVEIEADERFNHARGGSCRNGSDVTLISVSRFTKDKNLDCLVRVFRRLHDSVPNARLILIGDGPEREQLKAEAKDLYESGAIEMPGAIYDERTLATYFASANLYVIPGAAGLSVNHALSYGVPVVAFRRGPKGPFHHPEIEYVVEDVTGWLADDFSEDGLYEVIIKALNKNLIGQKEKIRAFVVENLTLSSMVDRFGQAIGTSPKGKVGLR